MKNDNFLWKSTYQNIQAEQKIDILGMLSFYFMRRTKMYSKKRGIRICLFDKSRTQGNVKCHFLHQESWLRWIVFEQANNK